MTDEVDRTKLGGRKFSSEQRSAEIEKVFKPVSFFSAEGQKRFREFSLLAAVRTATGDEEAALKERLRVEPPAEDKPRQDRERRRRSAGTEDDELPAPGRSRRASGRPATKPSVEADAAPIEAIGGRSARVPPKSTTPADAVPEDDGVRREQAAPGRLSPRGVLGGSSRNS